MYIDLKILKASGGVFTPNSKFISLLALLKKKQSVLSNPTSDNLCFVRALVLAREHYKYKQNKIDKK